jgi:hypothetical protein
MTMHWRSRTILRLSGKPAPQAPETKTGKHTQAAILRRFFVVLDKLETRLKSLRGSDR